MQVSQKRLLWLLMFFFMMTGCSYVTSSDNDYEKIVNNVISVENNMVNTTSIGYKYYLPKPVALISDKNNNQEFLINGKNAYLYVDIISYYYKNNDNNINSEENIYYYKQLKYNNKSGYIKIKEIDNNYFLELFYNYGLFQTIVDAPHLNETILLASSILESIRYNDKIIEDLVNSNYFDSKDQQYNLPSPEESGESNFLEYIEEYAVYEDKNNELPDDKSINNEETS
ncbi:MAG: hypothetical protein Q4G04_05145 [bacterium]|nr:hypothetical protein [bacterium]